MAYSEDTADTLRADLRVPCGERKMFGGLAFMTRGNMIAGVIGGDAMYRVGKDAIDDAMALPGVDRMKMGARVMGGYVMLGADHLHDEDTRAALMTMAQHFVGGLPAK